MSSTVPIQLNQELEQERDAQVNQLLQIIESQRVQLQQLQQQQSSNERTADRESIEHDLRSILPPDFPWDFEPKWPLTHAERIAELNQLSRYYDKTHHKDNIRAAKEYHAKFPPTDLVPNETIWFRNGKQSTQAEVDLEGGVIWSEGPPIADDFMNAQPATQPQSLTPLGSPATTTGATNFEYYERPPSGSHMYEV